MLVASRKKNKNKNCLRYPWSGDLIRAIEIKTKLSLIERISYAYGNRLGPHSGKGLHGNFGHSLLFITTFTHITLHEWKVTD